MPIFCASVSLLISRQLGVQCSFRYFSGSWKHRPLIPVNRIRALHLVDRVTNLSVVPYLSLELTRGADTKELTEGAPVTNSIVDAAFYMEPLFSLSSRHHNGPGDDADMHGPGNGKDVALSYCCLPLPCLITIYRVGQAVLFNRQTTTAAI